MNKPTNKPSSACFSSGPCKKRPNWSLSVLESNVYGRSHRSKEGKSLLKEIIDRSKKILNIPSDYYLGIFVGSDTAAVELALWNFVGPRDVDCFSWEAFSKDWLTDLVKELKHDKVNDYSAGYGLLPDLSKANPDNDIVFAYNGTTSGVKVPNLDWIKSDRKGITICDATSAVFSEDIDWSKIDVLTYSWQKVMGGEAGHGILILSPRAVKRLEENPPKRPIPKLFRILKNGKVDLEIFDGTIINTPSLLACVDALDSLKWIESIGGLEGSIQRTRDNFGAVKDWVYKGKNFSFLAQKPEYTSLTSVCLVCSNAKYQSLDDKQKGEFMKKVTDLLAKENVAYDINAYKTAPSGIRIWCGVTVEKRDIEILLQWVDWAFDVVYNEYF